MTKSSRVSAALNRTVLSLANTLKDGQHSHFGAPQPHDIRIKHMGFGDDIEDALHDEETTAWTEAKKAEDAVRAAIQDMTVNRQTLMATPMGQQKAQMGIQQSRMEAQSARKKYEEVANRRVEQLRKLVETLGIADPNQGQQFVMGEDSQDAPREQPQQGLPGNADQQTAEVSADGSEQVDEAGTRQPGAARQRAAGAQPVGATTAPKPSPTGAPKPVAPKPAIGGAPAGAGGAPKAPVAAPTSPTAATPAVKPPSAPQPGQAPAAAQARTVAPKPTQPKRSHPLLEHGKRIGQNIGDTARAVGGHYMDVMANTPYDRALHLADDEEDDFVVDEGFFHETPDDAKVDNNELDNPAYEGWKRGYPPKKVQRPNLTAERARYERAELEHRDENLDAKVDNHDTPSSPHAQHSTPDDGDPDEVTQQRQGRRPSEPEPPEWLEDENRRKSEHMEYLRRLAPRGTSMTQALDATVSRVEGMARVYNNRGMNEGMEDEDAKVDDDTYQPRRGAWGSIAGVRGNASGRPNSAAPSKSKTTPWSGTDRRLSPPETHEKGDHAEFDESSRVDQSAEDDWQRTGDFRRQRDDVRGTHTHPDVPHEKHSHPGVGMGFGHTAEEHSAKGHRPDQPMRREGGPMNNELRRALTTLAKTVQGIENYDEQANLEGNPDDGAPIADEVEGVRDVPDTIFPETDDGPTGIEENRDDLVSITSVGTLTKAICDDLALAAQISKGFPGYQQSEADRQAGQMFDQERMGQGGGWAKGNRGEVNTRGPRAFGGQAGPGRRPRRPQAAGSKANQDNDQRVPDKTPPAFHQHGSQQHTHEPAVHAGQPGPMNPRTGRHSVGPSEPLHGEPKQG